MPRKAVTSEAKRFALNMKTTEEIRRRLEGAAEASGRSLTHEVEYRLEQSLQEEDLLRRYFGSDDTIELLQGLSLVINYHLKRSGKPWQTDKSTRDAIRAHLEDFFDAFDNEENIERIPEASSTLQEGSNFSAADNLSTQEFEILQALTEGESDKLIARKLGTTERIVKLRIRSLLKKLAVLNRTQAAMWARQHLEFNADDHVDSSRDATGSVPSTPPVRPRRGRAA